MKSEATYEKIRYSLKRVPMVLVASLYELSRPSSPSGLFHGVVHR